jgi:transketolase
MRDRFIQTLSTLAETNPNLFLITGDLGFGVFDEFRRVHPDRFLNAGVAEQSMTGIATGMALEGKIVCTYSIANFPTLRCLEQIRNDACYHRADVKVVSVGGGFSYGPLGISHHATEDLAILRSLPDITVYTPCGLWETEEVTKLMISRPGTCYLRLDKATGHDDPVFPGETLETGRGRILREGADAAFLVAGGILAEVEKAAARLLSLIHI